MKSKSIALNTASLPSVPSSMFVPRQLHQAASLFYGKLHSEKNKTEAAPVCLLHSWSISLHKETEVKETGDKVEPHYRLCPFWNCLSVSIPYNLPTTSQCWMMILFTVFTHNKWPIFLSLYYFSVT